jgi:GTP-binding protein
MNKVDGVDPVMAAADFHALGLDTPWPIAAVHNRGVPALMEQVLSDIDTLAPAVSAADNGHQRAIEVAIIGRPNVGKSTLVNRLIGEERVLVYDMPGTTLVCRSSVMDRLLN